MRARDIGGWPSPDCEVGKHAACSGDGWDHENDRPAACPCLCHTPAEWGTP